MRAFSIVLIILLVASVAVAEKKGYVEPVPGGSRALDCTNAIPINCGDVVTGDNTGAVNNVDAYSCIGWNEAGGEVVYELVIPAGECYEVSAAITDLSADLDVFFLGSCDENDCLFYGNTSFTTNCLEPGTYYIVVDGYNGAASPFTLTVDCVECECPVPPCCPFENVVYEVDFNLGPSSFTVLPCGGGPTWEWGPLTNVEVPDIACDDVPVTNILGTTIAGDYPTSAGEIAMVGPFAIDQYSTCLELCHFYDIETSYDGGNVKVSTDGGTTWVPVSPSQGYPGSTNSFPFCIPSEPAYTGHPTFAFMRDCFDLSPFVGTNIMVGFFFGSDSSVTYPGWYIKWVKIGSSDSSPVQDGTWGTIKGMYR
jgi:hypothetical protein